MSDESLSSIISALEVYNDYLDHLVSRLDDITSKLDMLEGPKEWARNIKRAEQRLYAIEAEFSDFINYFSSLRINPVNSFPAFLTIRYKDWEEFKTQSTSAGLVSFLVEEKERVFQVSVLKDGKILVYSGEVPHDVRLLKSWISRELKIPEGKIVEGVLTIEYGTRHLSLIGAWKDGQG